MMYYDWIVHFNSMKNKRQIKYSILAPLRPINEKVTFMLCNIFISCSKFEKTSWAWRFSDGFPRNVEAHNLHEVTNVICSKGERTARAAAYNWS